jgi:hypothetical protein
LKLDGFRAIGRKSGRGAQLWSRNQKDFTRRFPGVVKGLAGLPSDTVIDGEIVALDVNGRPSFNLLQGFGNAQVLVFYAFDLLMLQGKDVRLWPLEDRRDLGNGNGQNALTPVSCGISWNCQTRKTKVFSNTRGSGAFLLYALMAYQTKSSSVCTLNPADSTAAALGPNPSGSGVTTRIFSEGHCESSMMCGQIASRQTKLPGISAGWR